MKVFDAKIIKNEQIAKGYFYLTVEAKEKFSVIPGQFFMLKVAGDFEPLLRRPFSIAHVAYKGSKTLLTFIYKVIGKGTQILSEFKKGVMINILGPLGRGYNIDFNSPAFLIGGGIGTAPLLELSKVLYEKNGAAGNVFIGGRTNDDLIGIDAFEKYNSKINIATDNGSAGEKGLVTEIFEKFLKKNKVKIGTIYACGPAPMLKAVSQIASKYSLSCQVSVEAYMACGIGLCLGCVVKGVPSFDNSVEEVSEEDFRYIRVCKEGPVFDSKDLIWE